MHNCASIIHSVVFNELIRLLEAAGPIYSVMRGQSLINHLVKCENGTGVDPDTCTMQENDPSE